MIDKFISSSRIATPRKSQTTKVIHSDFLTVAEAMTSAFSTIENNQAWHLNAFFGSCVGIVIAKALVVIESRLYRALI